ncbi:MAG: hypothetical protein ABL962_19250, partial [Fimbriimonadaceae bacterium]
DESGREEESGGFHVAHFNDIRPACQSIRTATVARIVQPSLLNVALRAYPSRVSSPPTSAPDSEFSEPDSPLSDPDR